MKRRFIIYRRKLGGTFYIEDTQTKKQESLGTKDRAEATSLLHARNEAIRQPQLNLLIAKAYLAGTDSGVSTRTWQDAFNAIIENKHGPTKERWQRAVTPKAAERYRERKVPSGTKTDRHDGWSLADALRTDGHGWRPLLPQDEATATLRALCRDEIALIEQRTALVNQLIAALREYYPVALELFDDWTQPFTWALIQQFPTPLTLQSAGKRQWEKFLHTHRPGHPGPSKTPFCRVGAVSV